MNRHYSSLSAFTLAGMLCLAAPVANADAEPRIPVRFEGVHILELPRHDTDRRSIEAALERARLRSQLDDKTVAQRLQVMDHTTEFIWPVREAVNVGDPTVQSISNFLDQDGFDGQLEDWNCGGENARTYDGHNGMDIFMAPFNWYKMERDAGIVVAAAPGVIQQKVGDQPERSCEVNDTGGDNNLVVIEHADGSWGIYAHMRTDSLTAKPLGATVEAGEYLGVIGSAGFSTGPHLHFETGFWENGGWTPQDPYAGQCNDINDSTWWENQPPYYEPGIMSIATHHAAPVYPPCPETETPNYADDFDAGDTVFLSLTLRDVTLGDSASIEVMTPDGAVAIATSYDEQNNDHIAAASISLSFGLPGNAAAGTWNYRVTYKGEVENHAFRVDTPPPAAPVLAAANNAWNGLWYDPALDGEGYNIVTTAGGTVIYFYGSDRNGKRLWLVSELVTTAFQNGQQKTIVMYESTGGTHESPVPSNRGLSIWGELRLSFSSCNAGQARLVGEDGNKLSALTKLAGVPGSNCVTNPATDVSPYAGLWYDATLDGEGFNLVISPFGAILYYYGFDASGDRLWLVSPPFEFDFADGNLVTVDLYKATQGTFANPVPVDTENAGVWGSITVRGRTCQTMEYTLDTKEGDKHMDAQRLVGVVGLDC